MLWHDQGHDKAENPLYEHYKSPGTFWKDQKNDTDDYNETTNGKVHQTRDTIYENCEDRFYPGEDLCHFSDSEGDEDDEHVQEACRQLEYVRLSDDDSDSYFPT